MPVKKKKIFIPALLFAFCAILAIGSVALASRFGRSGFSGNPNINGGADCTACHGPGAAEPLVQIDGPLLVDAGSTNSYIVTLTGGPAVTGGVNISTSNVDGYVAGTLAALDNALHVIDGELAHTVPQAFDGEPLQFSFEWVAPTYDGDVTLYAAGNSSSGQLDLLGDGIGVDSLSVTVQNGSGTRPLPPEQTPSTAQLTLFASGLDTPISVTHAGDSRLFAAQQPGAIRVIDSTGAVLPTPFLDITDRVDDTEREQGLLGLAFHPEYATNGFFYVNYIVDMGDALDRTRISRFSVSSDANVADAASEMVVMEFEQLEENHNGGNIAFGPDGYLYIASGDGGGGGDTQNAGQDASSPLGALLRIDVDQTDNAFGPDCDLSGGSNYTIPADNAVRDGVGGAGCDEIYALGLRNPWRFSFDRQTGDLWLADVGQYEYEEIDFLPAGTRGGANFGWRCYEGNAEYYINGCNGSEYITPVYDYGRSDGCSVTGGYVYRGAQNPDLWGDYFFSDFCQSELRALSGDPTDLQYAVAHDGSTVNSVAAFAEDANGELYVVSSGSGELYQISEAEEGVPLESSLLVFHRTTGYRHGSIDAGIEMIERFGAENGWFVTDSQDANDINASNLAQYDAVIFLNSTGGDLLNNDQVNALVAYVEGGGGFVGIHGATDALYDNSNYESLLGVLIDVSNRHASNNTQGDLAVAALPVNAGLPNPFSMEDEFYNFNYQPDTTYILTIDEATYSGHNGIGGANHPLAWVKERGNGCVFYSSLGHDDHLYSGTEPMDLNFQTHIENGIKWAMSCFVPPTPTATPIPTFTPTPTFTLTPVPTDTPLPAPTDTPVPVDSATPTPAATATLLVTAVATDEPTATTMPTVTSTPTLAPTSTPTLLPGETSVPEPTATDLPPTSTPTAVSATATPVTSTPATSTPVPTATPRPPTPTPIGPTATATGTPDPLTQSVNFVTLSDGQIFAPGDSLYVLVTTGDALGDSPNVQLYVNDEFVREERVAPYEWGAIGQDDLPLQALAAGSYTLRVVVTTSGGLSTSKEIQIQVGLPAVTATPPVTPMSTVLPEPTKDAVDLYSIFLSLIELGMEEE